MAADDDPRVWFPRVLVSLERLAALRSGHTAADLGDPDLLAAVERHLEIVSEGSRHVADDFKTEHPEIQWRRVADIGNRIRHGYNAVDPVRLWSIVESDLDAVAAAIGAYVKSLDAD